jgi:hypothetical protein
MEPVAAGFELGHERLVVENLAVHHEVKPAGLVRHGLAAVGRVDNRQPPHAQEQALVAEKGLVVGAAVA